MVGRKSRGWAVVGEEGIKNLFLGWHLLRSGVRSSWIIWVGLFLGDFDCPVVTSCSSILPVTAARFVTVTKRLAQVL